MAGVFLLIHGAMIKLKGLIQNSSIFSKILVLLGIMCFSIILVSPFLTAITRFANNVDVLRLTQLLSSFAVFVIPPFIYAYLVGVKPTTFLSLNSTFNVQSIFLVFVFMLLVIPFVNLLGAINQQLILPQWLHGLEVWMKATEAEIAQVTQKLLLIDNFTLLLFNILVVAILPAIGEELLCRGVLIQIFKNWKGIYVAIWLTAFLFSAVHLQFYGFLPRLLFGAFFGYLLLWSKSMWLPIFAHFINNATAVIFYYLAKNGFNLIDLDTIGTGDTLWVGIVSFLLTVFGVILIKTQLLKVNA